MKLERINKSHIRPLAEIMSESFKCPPWNENWNISICEERIEDILSIKTSIGYIFMDKEEIIGGSVGYYLPYVDKKEFQLIEFFISPTHQHIGLGKKMFLKLVAELKIQGIDTISLETIPEVEQFYLKIGFKKQENVSLKIEL